jgi:hypothetical protein
MSFDVWGDPERGVRFPLRSRPFVRAGGPELPGPARIGIRYRFVREGRGWMSDSDPHGISHRFLFSPGAAGPLSPWP